MDTFELEKIERFFKKPLLFLVLFFRSPSCSQKNIYIYKNLNVIPPSGNCTTYVKIGQVQI